MTRLVLVLALLAACRKTDDELPASSTGPAPERAEPRPARVVDEPDPAPDEDVQGGEVPAEPGALEPRAPDDEPVAAAGQGGQPGAYCEHRARCGCPMPECLATMERMIHSPPVQDTVRCVTQLPCSSTCTDMADPSSAIYQACIGPVKAALQARGRAIDTINQMTRDVIDKYPGNTRVKITDETGAEIGETRR